jgi:hypothetical protein
MKDVLNISLDDYSAFPIVIGGVCHFVILLCNRRNTEKELMAG